MIRNAKKEISSSLSDNAAAFTAPKSKRRVAKSKTSGEGMAITTPAKKGSGLGAIVISIVFTTVIVGSLVYAWQKNNLEKTRDEFLLTKKSLEDRLNELQPPAPTTSPAANNGDEEFNAASDSARLINLGYKYDSKKSLFVALDGHESYSPDQATLSKLSKNNEQITSVYAPYRLQDTGLIYFTTLEAGAASTTINRVYTFNLRSKTITLVFEDGTKGYKLASLGAEDDKLILMASAPDFSAGKCYSPWSSADENIYFYLDLTNVNKGLQDYSLPKYKIDEGRQEELKCLEGKS